MHQSIQGATFHLEHVIPRSRGGSSDLDNLAWACPSCNLHKADRVEGADPETLKVTSLFNPRHDRWTDHFEWRDFEIVGLTPTGRVTATALHLNHSRRLLIRQAETAFGLFPPDADLIP
jgi:hypothetical protein